MEEHPTEGLSHVDERGRARMVDVGGKPVSRRKAVARARVLMQPETVGMIVEGRVPKGDVFAVARLAGIMAAKRTAELIPLCHPLPLTHVSVDLVAEEDGVRIESTTETEARTGVEMEALVAASVAGLALYDMCKAVDRGMTVTGVELVSKEGGASGAWRREDV